MKNSYTFAVVHWNQDPAAVLEELRKHIEKFIGERSTGVGTATIELSNPATCIGCEKDDRREWTEPEDHTCGKALSNFSDERELISNILDYVAVHPNSQISRILDSRESKQIIASALGLTDLVIP